MVKANEYLGSSGGGDTHGDIGGLLGSIQKSGVCCRVPLEDAGLKSPWEGQPNNKPWARRYVNGEFFLRMVLAVSGRCQRRVRYSIKCGSTRQRGGDADL